PSTTRVATASACAGGSTPTPRRRSRRPAPCPSISAGAGPRRRSCRPPKSSPDVPRMSKAAVAALLALALLAVAAGADTITLTNGRVIEADRAWFEGNEVRYEKNGGIYGLPKSLVTRLEAHATPAASADPDVLKARDLLAAKDAVEATRLLRVALGRDP